jgi:hypothetical protein
MNLRVLTVAIALLASGCSALPQRVDGPSAPAGVVGTWAFTVTGEQGTHRPVLRLVDRPAETCLSGDWLQAKVVSSDGMDLSKPAYRYRDGDLEILLVNGVCDAYTSFVGTTSGAGFEGDHVSYGLSHSEQHGHVTGVRRP